jgi:hypothetical protein
VEAEDMFLEEAGAFINELHRLTLLMDEEDDMGTDWSICPPDGESVVEKKWKMVAE